MRLMNRDDRRSPEVLAREVVRQDRHGRHVVERDLEEPLDLALMQVHREDAVDLGRLEQRSDQARRDRLARGALLVLP
jgi:hypothetical protein